MITEKENARISKFLSYVLRHQPDAIGIELDENGWTDVGLLIQKASKSGMKFDLEILKHIVETNNKKRFALNETFSMIRANQGHSVEVELGYAAKEPPEILYHGTGEKYVESIMKVGLEKKNRHHVHLTTELQTAISVGSRHGKPVVFEVLSMQMHKEKMEFYLSENGVWLTEHVPVMYMRLKENY